MSAVIVVIVVIAVLLAVVALLIKMRNTFARQSNAVEESWRQIDVELERRHDLIGNLVEVVKSSARFEQNTLAQIVQARSNAVASQGSGPQQQGRAEQQLGGALSNFFAVAEQYPELQSNRDFRYLQEQMVECEDRIAAGRRFYNGNVKAYNTRFDTFPSSTVRGSYTKSQYFEVDSPQVRAAPSMKGAFDSLNAPQQHQPQLGQGQPPFPGQQPQSQQPQPQYQQQPPQGYREQPPQG
ncbi:MAG: LemA family protein [Sciscionella sp.]